MHTTEPSRVTIRGARPASRPPHRRASRVVSVASAGLLLAGLTACGSSGASDSSAGGTGAEAPAQSDVVRGEGSGKAGRSAPGDLVQTRAVIMTGQVSLRSKDLVTVRSDIDRLVARYGGYIDKENTDDDERGRVSSSTLQLRVPSENFDAVMAAFDDIATVTSKNTQAEDVTTEVIDVEARVRTAQVSLERLRKFLGKATNVDSVIRLESEISQREADLASLLAQQRYLKNQTSLGTITVSMTRTTTAVEDDPLADAGFLTGLRNGWNAFLDLAVIAATVAGALLPFALALAVVVVPLVLLLRAHRRRRPARPGTPPTPPPTPPPGPPAPQSATAPNGRG